MTNLSSTIRVRVAHLTQGEVYAEVREAYAAEREISDAAAVTIAAWWAAPSNPAFTALATGCATTAEAIGADICREYNVLPYDGIDRLCLDMLGTWAINFARECGDDDPQCVECGWPVHQFVTPLGQTGWEHDRIPLDTPLADVPDDAVSRGTEWVVQHYALVVTR